MIHLQLPDRQVFTVERKGPQLLFQQGRVQHNESTFKMLWELWRKSNRLIR